MLNLWKSCILPHFLPYLRYISDESQVQMLQASLNRSLSAPYCMSMAIPQSYFKRLRQVFPPCTKLRTFSLHNSDQVSLLPPCHYSTFSLATMACYKLCPWTHLKPACRLQYVTWTSHFSLSTVTMLPIPQNVNLANTDTRGALLTLVGGHQCIGRTFLGS